MRQHDDMGRERHPTGPHTHPGQVTKPRLHALPERAPMGRGFELALVHTDAPRPIAARPFTPTGVTRN
ncbi:hypothetical protein ACFQ0G_54010, partial [Streptomyces chiangmaiensis]